MNEHYQFLYNLQDSGVTNMFDAGPYLAAEFGLEKRDAQKITEAWMEQWNEKDHDEAVK